MLVCLALGAVPALAQESAAEPAAWTEATVEVLNDDGVIPLEAIPEDADHITFARIVIEPGVSGEGPSYQPQRWANLEYVEQGWTRGSSAERSRVWYASPTFSRAASPDHTSVYGRPVRNGMATSVS